MTAFFRYLAASGARRAGARAGMDRRFQKVPEATPMRMDKLTSRFQQALADAQSLAVGRDHNMLEPAHLMAALLDPQGGSTAPLLAQAGVNVAALRTHVGQALDKLPSV